ncbi:MAG: glycerol-3-phosphate 1-O-acyltransferase PlsY [Phycisphaeraceae bacterium]|nr:glycerol-3-phosphate 1-O-acyltransferase PlsY [Phycisphaeraceae bacterium]
MNWVLLVAMPVAFLAGSVPFGLLIARRHGIDIRQHGSKNIGATNVLRVLGKKAGAQCFALDVLKGLVPTAAAGAIAGLLGRFDIASGDALLWLGVMVCPILGHMFSPWVGFKGGKGVATGLGSLLGVFPVLTIAGVGAFALWVVVVARWRYVGLASSIAAASLPLWIAGSFVAAGNLGWLGRAWYEAGWAFLVVGVLLAGLVVFKHRGNIRRTLAGTESKFGERVEVAR